MEKPNKKKLLDGLLAILDNPEVSDEMALSALKTLKKYDKDKAQEKALSMYNAGVKIVPVTDILLSLIPPEKKVGMEVIDADKWSES